MPDNLLSCFKAYDVRGQINVNINVDIAYRIGRAVAQHFSARVIVVGHDARATSPEFASAVARGVLDAGGDVLEIGLCGTEEMYWAVTEFEACAGIEVTASHNPIDYNGMKIVKSGSRPLDDIEDFQPIKKLASSQDWQAVTNTGTLRDVSAVARDRYVDRVLSFLQIENLKPLGIVVNSGNGAAGPTFDAIAKRLDELGAPLEFIRVHHEPDATFPNGIPNPLLPENHPTTGDFVRSHYADFGVAFDGDFDRCFFFDGDGNFVPGEYVVGLLAAIFLQREPGGKVVHDPRVIWNSIDIINSLNGVAIQSKTGHAFIKQAMRREKAVYGGEMSAHHYFRDFAYCDSGMIPWLLVAELVSSSGKSLSDWIGDRFEKFPSSGEINFRVNDANVAITRVLERYRNGATIDETDGVSLSFDDWRFNLRKSNTEPLVRLNIEGKQRADLIGVRVEEISQVLQNEK